MALYAVITPFQFECIKKKQHKHLDPKLFCKPHFCPLTSKDKAERIASERNNWTADTKVLHIVKFLVPYSFLSKFAKIYATEQANSFFVMNKDDVSNLNKQIVGYIEKVNTVDHANQLASI